MKYYIIAGEASGDLHSANLMKEIKKLDPHAEFRGWGGDLMQEQGCRLVKHYKEVAFMGFAEVIMNLRVILRSIKLCKKDLLKYIPDCVILVDYPGFNLRIAKYVRKIGFRAFYYISPQVWAWKSSRVKTIKTCVDRLFVILPFEQEYFKKHNYHVDFVGHPLLDVIDDFQANKKSFREINQLDETRDIVALLPGSRKQEIQTILPIMMTVVDQFPQQQFVIAGMRVHPESYYQQFIGNRAVKIIYNQTYDLISNSKAACVTSGTATLETALFKIPEVVCYKGSNVSYQIAKRLVGKNIKYISLINLIMDRAVVKELIQDEFTTETLRNELHELLYNQRYIQEFEKDYTELRQKLGGQGASHLTAKLIVDAVS